MKCPICHFDNGPEKSACGNCGARLPADARPGASRPPADALPEGGEDAGKTVAIPSLSSSLTLGSTFAGRYRIIQELGRGGMGVVYKAEDVRLKRAVALKFLPWWLTSDAASKERFIHEAQTASALDHPNICTIYEVDETAEGQMFIAMALCEGEPLTRRLDRGPLKVEETLDIAIGVAGGLSAAHAAGIVHRDIKPGNIMLMDSKRVRIVDFGLAKLAGEARLTTAGVAVGTVDYMSPEQARGDDVDSRTDIWAVGIVLYEMLTGRRPFRGDSQQAVIHSILHGNIEHISRLRAGIPRELSGVIDRCLKRNPSDRYATAGELQTDLEAIRGSTSSARAAAGRGLAGLRWCWGGRLRRGLRIAAPALGLVALAVVMLATLPRGRPLLTFRSAAPWVQLGTGPPQLPAARYLVVLPFDAAGDAGDRALCDGLVGVAAGKLARVSAPGDSLRVASVETVREDSIMTPGQAREQLGANLALKGTVASRGDLITLGASLVDTRSLHRLDTLTVSDPLANLSTWQDRLVLGIAGMLGMDPEPGRLAALRVGSTSVPEAYRWFLRGWGYLKPAVGEPQFGSAISAFGKAIAEDSSFAAAWVGMGDAALQEFDDTKDRDLLDKASLWARHATDVNNVMPAAFELLGRVEATSGRYDEAAGALARAVELDSTYFIAYNWLGFIYLSQKKYERALEALKTAETLRPKDFNGYGNLGAAYFYCNMWEEAKQALEKSLLSPTARAASKARAASNLGTIYFHEGRYADGEAKYQQALELQPDDYVIVGNYADDCYWIPGKMDTAKALFREAARIGEQRLANDPSNAAVLADLASYYSMVEDRTRAEACLDRVIRQGPSDCFVLNRVAEACEQLGKRDQALLWLERALAGGYPAVLVDRYPGWRNLRGDERFREIRQRY